MTVLQNSTSKEFSSNTASDQKPERGPVLNESSALGELIANLGSDASQNLVNIFEYGPSYLNCKQVNYVENCDSIFPSIEAPMEVPISGTNKLLLLYGLQTEVDSEKLRIFTALISQQERNLQDSLKVRSLRSYSNSLFESCPDGIVLTDGRGYIIKTNRAMVAMARKPLTSLIGLRVSNLTSKEGRLKAFDALRKLKHQSKASLDCQMKVGAGRTIPVSISFSDVTVRDERLILATVRDMSYLEEEKDRFGNFEASLARSIRNATDAFLFYDEFGRITEVNPATEKLTGVFETRLVGRAVDDLLSDDSLRNFRKGVSQLNENGYAAFDCRIKSSDGSEIPSRAILMQFELEGAQRCRLILQDMRK